MNERDRARRLILCAVVIGFVARALFAFAYWQDRPLTIDQTEYLLLAEQVLHGEGLTYPPGERRLMRSPGYPIFLAAVGSVASGQGPIRLVQCLLGVVAIFQIAILARRVGGDRAAVVAAWLAALYPPLVFEPAYVLSEPLYTVLSLGAVIGAWNLFQAVDRRAALRWSALTGAISGVVLLVRPEFAFFVGLLGLWLLWQRRIVAAAIVGVTTAAVVAPWPLYNVSAHDRVIVLSSRGGPNFWMGNNELAVGDGDVSSNPPMAAAYISLMSENPDLSPEALEQLFYRRSFEFIVESPVEWMVLLAKKAFWFIVPFGPSYQSRSGLFWASHAVSWLLLLGATIAAWPSVRRIQPPPVALVLAALAVVVTSLLFFPLERYRVPLLDPVMLACVATLANRRA